jgi:tetratricopeptide (TPR) repeat protein
MAANVATILEDARAQEMNPKVALLYHLSSEQAINAAYVLSVSIALTPDQLREIVTDVWPASSEQSPASPHQDFITELGRWPVIHKARDGWQITESVANQLAGDFLSKDPDRYVKVHELLVALEESREAFDGDDEWFIQGRIAFYLAGFDSETAVEKFGWAFADPPIMDRVTCRLWLSGLALRQESLLEAHEREIAFFKGFRLYMSSPSRTDALPHFRLVYQGEMNDVYGAIALHLAGVIEKRRDVDQAIDLFETSVAISQKLGLWENEVMARHSLIWALIQRGRKNLDDVVKAHELAEDNLKLATSYKDPVTELWCERTAAITRWLSRESLNPKDRASVEGDASSLAETLMKLETSAIGLGDFETSLLAANDAAGILRDMGDFEGALRYMEKTLGDTASIVGNLAGLRKFGQTAVSIKKLTKDPDYLRRIDRILQRMRERSGW